MTNRITVIVAVICVLLMATIVAGQDVTPTRATTVTGFLSCSNDNAVGGRTCPFQIHYVDFVQGKTYCVRIESSEFNPAMLLEDLDGNPMAMDVDEFNTMPGCIVFRAPVTASYRLIASATLPMTEGFYRINIRELPTVFEVAAELESTDPRTNDCHERSYDVPLIAGRRYVIDLGSREFDAYVKLMTTDNMIVAFEDERRPMSGARIVFTAPRTETYRIVATSLAPHSTGTFALSVASVNSAQRAGSVSDGFCGTVADASGSLFGHAMIRLIDVRQTHRLDLQILHRQVGQAS